jgi:hypothetical protein
MPKNIVKENYSLEKISPGKQAIVFLEFLLEKMIIVVIQLL